MNPQLRMIFGPSLLVVLGIVADIFWGANLHASPGAVVAYFGAIGLFVLYSMRAALEWHSMETLHTPFDGNYPLVGGRWETVADMPLAVVPFKCANVPKFGVVGKPKAWLLTPPEWLERFGRSYLLHSRLFWTGHKFRAFPEVADALHRAGYDETNPEHDIAIAAFGTMESDRTIATLDLKVLGEMSTAKLDEFSEMARKAVSDVERRQGLLRTIRGRR